MLFLRYLTLLIISLSVLAFAFEIDEMTVSETSPPGKPSPPRPEESHIEKEPTTPSSGTSKTSIQGQPETVPDASITQEPEWVTGFKLFAVMSGLTLVCLLMLLDTSIVVTASDPNLR